MMGFKDFFFCRRCENVFDGSKDIVFVTVELLEILQCMIDVKVMKISV